MNMGAFRKAALGTLGASLITAGVATMAAPHGSDYINGRIEEGVRNKPWYTFMISKKDARKIGNKKLKRAIGKSAYRLHEDMSKNPSKYRALGGLGVAAGIATLGSAARRRKEGGGMPAAGYLDNTFERESETHYIDDIDTPTRVIKLYPAESPYSADRMAA
jgi:hypothetical protein